ncbi:hypothetical protein P691DRAFT_770788 [Macrolepiota fuliginosa MF-IS2]|uniref:VHS domain-containing protein n=1 Tax=Macrolepiota fuliginosa MF-IS2 TaxID=1400762 RepID=A0A9P5XM77_9AGAR|nr:hypothetical protein P691DRAFT_770788 [Macrolepiota fuliginosa MF-IS2]
MSISSFNFKQAFGRDKPHSSVTDWVEIMTAAQTAEESYEGIPELVDAINLQSSGPTEAARALRKKMKHGGPHQQYRAIVIMRSLLDNIPAKMKVAFADSQFLDVVKAIWNDPYVDKRVKKRMTLVLHTWQEQYRNDPAMSTFGNLYGQLKKEKQHPLKDQDVVAYLGHPNDQANDARKQAAKLEKEREKEKEKEKGKEKEVKKKEQERAGEQRKRRRSFNFERDKPKIMNSIVEASQASSQLINAIMLVNLETDTLETNADVQASVTKAKSAKRVIMRYTQLVENEELIGTLIETHERLEAALNTYTQLITPDDAAAITSGMAKATLTDQELNQIRADNSATIERTRELDSTSTHELEPEEGKGKGNNAYDNFMHPDLADLDFDAARSLPPPIKPRPLSDDGAGRAVDEDRRGSLSDYSDYESSDEETHVGTSKRRNYVTISDDSGEERAVAVGSVAQSQTSAHQPAAVAAPVRTAVDDDPFADPFADKH